MEPKLKFIKEVNVELRSKLIYFINSSSCEGTLHKIWISL